ncbi:MAG: metallophosphoesterase family protein [Candidatus Bipolaricaulota bacterium]
MINEKTTKLTTVLILGITFMFLANSPFLFGQSSDEIWGPYLTVGEGGSIVVNWKTAELRQGEVAYSVASPADDEVGSEKVERETKPVQFHHVRLDDLRGGTEYKYEVNDIGDPSTYYFRSMSEDLREFAFFVYGDNRTCVQRHRILTTWMAMDRWDPTFIFHTGDLVERPTTSRWADFFWAIEPFSRSTPLVPVLGNHEMYHQSYFDVFSLPTGDGASMRGWYSFEYGPINFVILDSNVNEIGLSRFLEQTEWLKRELEGQTRKYTVIFFHHPVYSSGYPSGVDTGLAESWGSLFEEHGVDLVFNGHVHAYERLVKDGVTYVVTGGGGAPTDNISPRLDISMKARGDSLHYVRVSVTETGLELETVEVARVERDGGSGRVGCGAELSGGRKIIDRVK